MDDDREAFEFAYALHLARQVDREAAQMIVEAAEAGLQERFSFAMVEDSSQAVVTLD
jgi:hypothetical protein